MRASLAAWFGRRRCGHKNFPQNELSTSTCTPFLLLSQLANILGHAETLTTEDVLHLLTGMGYGEAWLCGMCRSLFSIPPRGKSCFSIEPTTRGDYLITGRFLAAGSNREKVQRKR